ncbi:hypothetical protein SCHPADRAFT_71121 [Schizopora paradoxa]|uniref:Uncharacterized protein n=1 Tax=Schizopora paradoxa TaxID=27342 RepID=A0A0H2S4Z9_9AGAM|nr:hypothetical protein SCHPADRAFT_71121 [Schizopora paradoxa]
MTPPANLPDLPYELLASILIDASSAAPQIFCISISHVCRRLRQFALSLPQLWTHVSNYQTLDEVDTFLARSKDEKLVVYLLAMRRDGSNCQQFLKRVVPHRARWRVFGFKANELRRRFFFELAKIPRESASKRVQLPALEKLDLQCYDPSYELDEDLQMWGVLYFWKPWEMPNLRDVTISMVDENVSEDWHAFASWTLWGALGIFGTWSFPSST